MTKKNKIDFSKVAANVVKVPVQNFVEDSYLPYAHYVIMSRALISDDGLKPVQRRILYTMAQLNLTDTKDFIKAARIVGDTMGKYHPHGDSSIGDALSRMGQDFSLRVPLVDVQGSVGFVTGDDPAAPRYWEGRPTKAAMELLTDLKEGAIEMGLNYDGKFEEPAMLPIKWPVGLINGSQGIAVGYSSNMVPHNPTEVIDAVIEMIKNPNVTLNKIMKIMPGPDMPTGGVLTGFEGVRDYYETGRGTFYIRGRYEIVPETRGRHSIIFSEAPYQVSAEQIISTYDKQKRTNGRFKEISGIKDLSGMEDGFRLSVSVKAGANPEVVLKDLFRWTPLEQSFPVNMTVLKDGVPKVSSVIEMLQNFIDFRSECIANKVKSKISVLDKNINRSSGIIKVLVDIDKAINIIRKSDTTEVANKELQKIFEINDEQSSFILSMPLRRLTKSDSLSIEKQIKEDKRDREYLENVMSDETEFNKFMIKELKETRNVISSKRRTTINNMTQEELKIEEAKIKKIAKKAQENINCYVTLFNDFTITRTEKPYVQKRSPIGILSTVEIGTQESLVFVKKDGNALKVPVTHISEDLVVDVSVPTGIKKGEVVGFGKESIKEKRAHGILLVTSSGGVNIVNGKIPNSEEFSIVKLEDEKIVHSQWLTKDELSLQMVLISSDGNTLRFPIEQIRTSNSGAGTIKGIVLNEGANVVGASIVNGDNGEIVSCTHQTVKVTPISEIPSRNRGGKGLSLHKLNKNDEVISGYASLKVIANKSGKSLRLPELTDRATSGTKRSGKGIILGSF